MGSIKIESQRRQHPDKSDVEIAEKLARENGYVAVIRYKNSPTAPEHTDFGTCRTDDELKSYFKSTYCHDVEIVYDQRASAFVITPDLILKGRCTLCQRATSYQTLTPNAGDDFYICGRCASLICADCYPSLALTRVQQGYGLCPDCRIVLQRVLVGSYGKPGSSTELPSGRRPGSPIGDLPFIGPEILHETFVEYNEAELHGPGSEKMKQTTDYWNRGNYNKVFRLLGKAIALGLEPRQEADAHCLLGQIYIKRRQPDSAVSELIACLRLPERTHADAWQAAQRLYYFYSEAGCNEEAKLLRLFAEKANRPLRWRHTAELETDVRNLARLWLAQLSYEQELRRRSGWPRLWFQIRHKVQGLAR
jgi:hypothetical protein